MDHSAIACDKILDAEARSNDKETKIFPTNFDKSYNTQNFYSSFTFLLITIALLKAVSI